MEVNVMGKLVPVQLFIRERERFEAVIKVYTQIN